MRTGPGILSEGCFLGFLQVDFEVRLAPRKSCDLILDFLALKKMPVRNLKLLHKAAAGCARSRPLLFQLDPPWILVRLA